MKHVVIVVDVEPDGFFIDPNETAPWTGFAQAFDRLEQWRSDASESRDGANFTWAVRADFQIAHTYGRADWAHVAYGDQFAQLREQGDVLGVHVHCYRPAPDAPKDWIEDYGDQSWVEENVRMAVQAHREHYGEGPSYLAMGADWINHETIQLADSLGVLVDSSFVAQNRMHSPSRVDYTGTWADCRDVEALFYRPDVNDFRRQNSDRVMGIRCLPQTPASVRIHADPTGRSPLNAVRARAANALRTLRLKPHRRPVYKLYLSSPWDEIEFELRRLRRSGGPNYMTLIVDSRQFSAPDRRAVIDENLGRLLTSSLTRGVNFSSATSLIPAA